MIENINAYKGKKKFNIEKIIQDYKNYVYTIVCNNSKQILNQADVEEAVSEVFFNIWYNNEKIPDNISLKKYIAGIAKNVTIDKIREKIKYTNQVELSENISDETNEFDILTKKDDIKTAIVRELDRINDEDSKIFYKFYFEQKSIKEIANEVGLKDTTVKVKLYRIRKKIKNRFEKNNIFYKNFIIIIAVLILTISAYVIAKEIVKRFFIDSSDGVESAVQDGYVENIEKNSQSNGIKISVDSILMDDYNLAINFYLEFENEELVTNINYCKFPNLLILDENNNMLVAKFEDEEHSELSEMVNISESNYSGINDGSESIHIKSKTGNGILITYITHSDQFPNSKELNIMVDKVELYNGNNELSNIVKTVSGKWNIKFNLPEDFFERNTDVYTLKESNIEGLELIKANLSQTGIKIEISTKWGQQYYSDQDTYEIKLEKLRKINDEKLTFGYIVQNGISPLKNAYIQNSNGDVFYPAASSDSDGGMYILDDEVFYFQLFNMTKNDATNEIVVYIEKDENYFDITNEKYIRLVLNRKSE